MGLDIIPLRGDDDARVSFAYSGFSEFREQIADAVGINLRAMVGYNGTTPWPSADDEPLVHLLDHSDCDGSLGYEECAAISPRLRPLIDTVFPERDPAVIDTYYREAAIALCDLMDEVVEGTYWELRFS